MVTLLGFHFLRFGHGKDFEKGEIRIIDSAFFVMKNHLNLPARNKANKNKIFILEIYKINFRSFFSWLKFEWLVKQNMETFLYHLISSWLSGVHDH